MFRCISHLNYGQNTHIFSKFVFCIYALDIDVSENKNNLKLKVKPVFSLSMGLMMVNYSNSCIHSTI